MLLLAILDGWGYREEKEGNAIFHAKTPNMDKFMKQYPFTLLNTSGLAVGLPPGQMGNSEVGHLNIGAGRIVYQDSMRILKAIEDGTFFENEVLKEAMNMAKSTNLHLAGLIGNGGVHSMMPHLYALLRMAKMNDVKNVYLHCFTDGRDTPPKSAITHVKELEDELRRIGTGKIVSVVGRYYAMDRDKRWNRTKKAYDMMVYGKGVKAESAEKAIEMAYGRGETDEFISPSIVGDVKVEDGDVIIFFNFRPDRMRQLYMAFAEDDFKYFERKNMSIHAVALTEYYDGINAAFRKEIIKNTFGEVISKHGLKQLRIAETEKYAHVTYFFNGGREEPFANEDRCLIPSPKVSTYDLKPEMSAYELTEELLRRIEMDYDVIIVNYANPDMVGHTGVWNAAIKAVETVDECIGKVVEKVLSGNGVAIITADHGNAEEMVDKEGNPKTAHTTNPVPFIIAGAGDMKLRRGNLGDIAPTMLHLLEIDKPEEMSGKSLIID